MRASICAGASSISGSPVSDVVTCSQTIDAISLLCSRGSSARSDVVKRNRRKAATIVAKPDTLDEDIRRCSIGLEHEKCEDAFYCSSDPVICVAVRYPSPSPEDPSL